MRNLTLGDVVAGSWRFLAVVVTLGFLSGCAVGTTDFDNDPDLFTDTEEIPERPGALETLTGKRLELEF